MRGVGGPLLCIGDLLSDVGEEDSAGVDQVPVEIVDDGYLGPKDAAADLPRIFQEHYNHLKEALAGSDHSWTDLTLKLCSAVETANKVVQDTHTSVAAISEKVNELETVIRKSESAVAVARSINIGLNQKSIQQQ